jgi:hypothetical protein
MIAKENKNSNGMIHADPAHPRLVAMADEQISRAEFLQSARPSITILSRIFADTQENPVIKRMAAERILESPDASKALIRLARQELEQ